MKSINPTIDEKLRIRSSGPALVLALFCAWTAWVPQVTALGFRVPNQDASAIARGNAFAATADDPSALYYNPAGITQLDGQNIQVGSLFYLGIYGDFQSQNGTTYHNEPEVIPVPALQYTVTPKDLPLSFGLGLYAPFGLRVEWPDYVPFRQDGIKATINYLTVNPVVAWKLLPELSIAAGPTFNFSQVDFVQGVFAAPFFNDRAEFKGDGYSFGFNLGLLWQPRSEWSFGLSYRSSSRMNYNGHFSLSPTPPLPLTYMATTTTIDYPDIVIGGVSWRPTTNWNFEVDLDWANWSTVHNLALQYVSARNLDWHSSFMPEIGVTRYLAKGYYVSAGYFFSQASASADFFTPLDPDTNLHIGSIGGGYRGKHWNWAVAFQAIIGGWREVNVNPTVNPAVSGQYRVWTPTLSFTVGYHF